MVQSVHGCQFNVRGRVSSVACFADACLAFAPFIRFSDYLARLFVVSDSLEDGVTEVPVSGPFGEADLAHEDRLKPHGRLALSGGKTIAPGAAIAFGEVDERAARLSQWLGPFDELPDLAVGEPAHLGGITKLAP
jgi:hypothetical protein